MSLDFRKTRKVPRSTGTAIVVIAVCAVLAAVTVVIGGSDNDLIQMEKWERLNPEPFPPAGAPTT